jgi:cell division transport system permease protein
MNRRIDYPQKKPTKNKKQASRKASHHTAVARSSVSDGVPSKNERASRVDTSGMLQAWWAHHRYSCRDSLQRLLNDPWQSFLTWLVVAIALILPAILYLGLNHAQQVGKHWQGSTTMSAYIQYHAQPLAIQSLQQRLNDWLQVAELEVITPEKAQQEFQQYSGLGDVLASLEVNPLPTVLTITPHAEYHSPEQLQELQSLLQAEPLIDAVQLDLGWLRRLQAIMNVAQHSVLALACLLAFGVLLIIGNTIRLAIENRRDEIVVVKMVGGTDGFVRRPFLYTGFWYGIGGGGCALVILMLTSLWLNDPVQALLSLYSSGYTLTWMSWGYSLIMVLGAGVLGWMGAWLAVSRHLKHIEPE